MGLFRSVINLPGLVFLENLYRLVLEDLNGVVAEGVVVAALVGLEQPLSHGDAGDDRVALDRVVVRPVGQVDG